MLGAGLAGTAVSGTVAPVLVRYDRSSSTPRSPRRPRPRLALLLATAVLVAVLVRWPHGRDAAFLLALLVMVPVLARWSDPAAVLLAGGPLFVVGYVIGARRARRPA